MIVLVGCLESTVAASILREGLKGVEGIGATMIVIGGVLGGINSLTTGISVSFLLKRAYSIHLDFNLVCRRGVCYNLLLV
jgi:hypothetical protein